jgi:NRPS condensation-like uncharacterized protein
MDYPAEIFDQIQLLFGVNRLNDHELHCVLRFERAPDAEILRKSVVASIAAIPILGARYVDGARPHWTSLDARDFARAFIVAATSTDFEAFLVSRIDETVGPQVAVCLYEAGCAVAIRMNHMVSDAAGFKQYLDFLSMTYSALASGSAFSPTLIAGDRSIRGVLRRFSWSVRLKSLLLQSGENNRAGKHRFPFSGDDEAQPFIVTCKLGRPRVAALNAYCRATGATLNDAVLAAFYRCLFARLAPRPGEAVQIPIMVDMRRYLGGSGEFTSLTNLTSMVASELEHRPGERFESALARVKATIDAKKAAEIGLNGFVKLDLAFRILGERIVNRRLRSQFAQPYICMTNVGKLDPNRIAFGDRRPCDAYLCGSIKHKPYFQLAMSSYDGEITFSVNQYGVGDDRRRIQLFLDDIDAELPTCIPDDETRGAATIAG